jgi:hypothetical protein
MKSCWVLLVGLLCIPAWCGNPQIISDARSRETAKNLTAYNGKWWARADHYERLGFFWGADDCERWDAHVPTSYKVPEDAFDEITKYYNAHPAEQGLPVVEVGKRVAAHVRPSKPLEGGEVWNNPHGFLNGFWFKSGAESKRFGFLEGYIGCLRTYIKGGAEAYPKPIHYYDDKIWDYVDTHGVEASQEPAADILRRFRVKPRN